MHHSMWGAWGVMRGRTPWDWYAKDGLRHFNLRFWQRGNLTPAPGSPSSGRLYADRTICQPPALELPRPRPHKRTCPMVSVQRCRASVPASSVLRTKRKGRRSTDLSIGRQRTRPEKRHRRSQADTRIHGPAICRSCRRAPGCAQTAVHSPSCSSMHTLSCDIFRNLRA